MRSLDPLTGAQSSCGGTKMNVGRFEAILKKKRGGYLPKKILKHTKIRVTDRYTFNVSVWVADTPQSNFKPTVNLVLSHNGDILRLCFDKVTDLMIAIHELQEFVLDSSTLIHQRHAEALGEFLSYQKGAIPSPPNDYTLCTVIQDGRGERHLRPTITVDPETGEILDRQDGCAASGRR
jgi:hypothetical protein